jgi:hypothetical protein
MSIEDEPTGFVFPTPRHNVAVNEWGLAKTMCRCNGIPAWSCRAAPKCRICKRKRAERRTEKEEERQKVKQDTEEASETGGEGSSSIVVKVTPADEDGDEISDENRSGDQMQIDEKGSGDVWATEKTVENVIQEDSELLLLKDLRSSELESRKGNRDLREDRLELENTLEIKKLKDAEVTAFTGSDDNVAVETREWGNFEPGMKEVKQTTSEVKLKFPSSNDASTAMEIDENGDTKANEQNVGNTSLESNALKNEKVHVGNSNETLQTEGNGGMNTPTEVSALKDRKQRISPGIDSSEPKQMKVKIANKYKVNVKTSRELLTEV